MKKINIKILGKFARFWILPPVFYLAIFIIFTFPLILRFQTHFFADAGDGLQNVWNIWWVNKSITELHGNPWYTTYLHYPLGTSLLGQTLNPFNGFMGILLLKVFSLVETYNLIVLFSFCISGFTAFWLSYSISNSYLGSLIAGYIFTFSEYHFMHAQGHMQLISQEWIPLFVLCWYLLINKPSVSKAVISGLVLFSVILCDYYYFLYCVITGILIAGWYAVKTKNLLFFFKKDYLYSLGVFIFVCLLTSGVLLFSLIRLNMQDPLIGSHDPFEYSLDLLAPFIPGGHWIFSELTKFYWSRLPGNINESSVYLGLSVVFLIIYALYKRRELQLRYLSINLWFIILIFFGMMALGPTLHIAGIPVYSWIMPYTVLQWLIPSINLSGVPVRMMVMVSLSASIISGIAFSHMFEHRGRKMVALQVVLYLLLIIEFLPAPIPETQILPPEYIVLLQKLPNNGSVFDKVTPQSVALYYQTIYDKPMAEGYISRMPTKVWAQVLKKEQALQARDYRTLLYVYQIRYLLVSTSLMNVKDQLKIDLLYDKQGVKLYSIEDTSYTGP